MKKIIIGSVAALSVYSTLVYAAQVITQDLVVQGSECVGIDCVSSESFGFDTLRLKENNLRIKFQDTSSSASFPSNDWQLTANDSTNGGQNKFSIDDIDGAKTPFTIEAGARSHSLYVDDGGKIGIGTSTPAVETHIVDGDSPTLRLEQNGSSGFTAQTWDLVGNETNFFIRDVNNGSQLPFRIKPGADTNSIYVDADDDIGLGTATPDARLHVNIDGGEEPSLLVNQDGTADSTQLIVAADGSVGVGLDAPTSKLHVKGNVNFQTDSLSTGSIVFDPTDGGIELSSGDNSSSYIDFKDNDADDYDGRLTFNSTSGQFLFIESGQINFKINNDGTVNADAFNTPSDYRLKENFSSIENPLSRLFKIAVQRYNYIANPSKSYEGFIAHNIQNVAPYAVSGQKNQVDKDGNAVYQSVDYSKLVPLLTASVQELTREVKRLEQKIEQLEENSARN